MLISGKLDDEVSEGSSSKFALQIDCEFFRGDCDFLKEAKGEVDPANAAKPWDGLGCAKCEWSSARIIGGKHTDPKDADG